MQTRESTETPARSASVPETARMYIRRLQAGLGDALKGKPEVVKLTLTSLLARGHLLIEDVPGVGKTTLAQSLAKSVDCSFSRLQFTSDMLPSDVLGVTVYNSHTQAFEFKHGPIFANFLLADEINRTTPKTQSALLEAMNETQVTVDGKSYPLPKPFMVIATQNPIEHHGTYPLPESQLDRFLMRVRIGYPGRESEREILRNGYRGEGPSIEPVLTAAEVLELQERADAVRVDPSLEDYMLAIVEQTRKHDSLALGVSPRGAQALYRAAQGHALVDGREYVLPDDIKRLAPAVFGHRVIVSSKVALAQRRSDLSDRIIEDILLHLDVPL
ncbi:MAG: AAA family ATPase [Bryobacteraceae bacterium]